MVCGHCYCIKSEHYFDGADGAACAGMNDKGEPCECEGFTAVLEVKTSMDKYADLSGVGDKAEVVAGPKKGLTGIVKSASAGKVTIVGAKDGTEHVVDETAVELKPKA